jgi:hypothetical protein
MTTVAINAKYADILAPLDDVQQVVDEAVRRYAVEKPGERIAEVRRVLRPFEERYGCPYEVFYARMTPTRILWLAYGRETQPGSAIFTPGSFTLMDFDAFIAWLTSHLPGG